MGQAGSKQEMFWEACGFGRVHLVQKFIEHGINVNWVSSVHACSPIHVASQGKPEVVRLLVEAGCDLSVIDSRGNTAAHHAAMKGHSDIIWMLAEAGADLNAQDKNGWTPLHCAAYYAHLSAVHVLLRYKCDVNILNKDGRSALVETARSKNYDDERVLGDIARELIKAGCDADLRCADLGEADFTALMFAAYHNHTDVAAALIEGGCQLDFASCYTKWTALHWAADRSHAGMVRLLLAAGANPSRTSMRGELASSRATDEGIRQTLEAAVRKWNQEGKEERLTLSCEHSINAQASLDTARALESLSSHAKNRDILATPMPTIPALGISSRSDPKIRYTKRSVDQVAIKSLNSVFPWKSYSKQGSPSPDNDGGIRHEKGELETRRKMFPLQDDKTNAFMDSLAERINYMTSKISAMSSIVVGDAGQAGRSTGSGRRSSPEEGLRKFTTEADDNTQDSGLSTLSNSGVISELATPDDMLTDLDANQSSYKSASPRSLKSFISGPSSKARNSSRNDVWDEKADACIIEANHRGFSILHALQERYRRSLYSEGRVVGASPGTDLVPTPEIMTEV